MIVNYILKIDPSTSPAKAEQLARVWDEVVRSIVDEMLTRAKPHMENIHINLREELALELEKLIVFISEKVVTDRIGSRIVNNIDPQVERELCFNLTGKENICNTAQILADRVWLRKYAERWKPKTDAALIKEAKQKKPKKLVTPQQVEDNHYIPKSFIKRYWSEGQSICRNVKTSEGLEEKKKTPLGSWGFRKNLYSDKLEAYFGIIEGNVVRPIQMLLNVEPLNNPQREALIGFIIIQKLRNPHFIESLKMSVAPVVVSEVGVEKAEDKQYMRAVYETLYSQNDFYNKLARPIMYSKWVVVRSETPDFVLPDVCNLFGRHEGRQYVLMPLNPNNCLIVLPFEICEPRIIPHYIKASGSMVNDLSYILRCAAKEEFLSSFDAFFATIRQEPTNLMQGVISVLAKITADE